MRTYWISFATDGGFLGACVVDVLAPMAAAGRCENLCEDHRWMLAALRISHLNKCNPGGEAAFEQLDRTLALTALLKRNTLMTRDQVLALGATKLSADSDVPSIDATENPVDT